MLITVAEVIGFAIVGVLTLLLALGLLAFALFIVFTVAGPVGGCLLSWLGPDGSADRWESWCDEMCDALDWGSD